MANYANLLATIAANIYTNGNNEVTAAMVKSACDQMVASLGAGYQFMGVATPTTNPGTPDEKVFYIASEPGTYTYLGGLVVNDGEVAIFKYNGTWSKEVTGAATAAQVTELGQEIHSRLLESSSFIERFALSYSTGELVSNNFYKTTDFIEVSEGIRINLTDCICDFSSFATLAAFDENGTYLQHKSINTNGYASLMYEVPNGVSKIRVSTLLSKQNCSVFVQSSLVNEISNKINFSAICDTEATNGQKRITLYNYYRSLDNRIIIRMQYANKSNDCYLQINRGENVKLYYNGNLATKDNSWEDGEYIEVFYDGIRYQSTKWERKKDGKYIIPQFKNGNIISIGDTVSSLIEYNRNGSCVSVGVNGTLIGISIRCGYNKFYGGYVSIDSTTVSVYRYESYREDETWHTGNHLLGTYSHGLVFGDKTNIQIIGNPINKKAFMLITNEHGETFGQEIDWFLAGQVQVVGTATQNIQVSISDIFSTNICKNIWLVGDSYLSYEDRERWTYWIMQYGVTEFCIQNLPGGSSSDMIISFRNSLETYTPKKAVWLAGMNDASDTDSTTPNSTWLENTQKFIWLCEVNGIEPILSTIPSVTLPKYHDAKSSWVRNSGYRYIDVADAVGSDAQGVWTTGLLSSDNVHPTQNGAKVIASRVMLDFPEILTCRALL